MKKSVELKSVESVAVESAEPSVASVASSKGGNPAKKVEAESPSEAKVSYTDEEIATMKAEAFEAGKKAVRLRVPALSGTVDALGLSKMLLDLKADLCRIQVPERLARLRIQYDGGVLKDFPPALLSALKKEGLITKDLETRARAAAKLAESLIALGFR